MNNLAGILMGLAALITAIATLVKVFKLEKNVNGRLTELKERAEKAAYKKGFIEGEAAEKAAGAEAANALLHTAAATARELIATAATMAKDLAATTASAAFARGIKTGLDAKDNR